MPILDMPLAELEKYQGRNPRPADFDAYWDEAIAEMKAVRADVQLDPVPTPARFAECFHLWFTGVGGARIHAKLVRPIDPAPAPAVVEFHGYSWRSGEWNEGYRWAAQGISWFALDVRGQGGLSEDIGGVKGPTLHGHIIRGLDDDPKKLMYRSVFLDCAQLAGIAMEQPFVDAARVGTNGGSQGGALSLACSALEPRIARTVTAFPFLCDYKRVWEMDLAKDAYDELRAFFRNHDPRHEREDLIWERLGYIDNQHLAPRIRSKVLMATGLMDSICPPSTQFAAFNKITSEKQVIVYPNHGHEGLPDLGDKTFEFLSAL